MKRVKAGLWAMLLSMVLGEILSLGSLVSTGGRLSSEHAASPLSAVTILVTLTEPLALVLEITAIVLVVTGSKQLAEKGYARRLALTAAAFFLAWGVLNLAVYMPLTLAGMREGSLELVRLGLGVKVVAALLQYSIPFLLAYGLARRGKVRQGLWLALVLTVVGGLGVTALPITSVRLEPVIVSSGKLYVPRYEVNYTSWPYPLFLVLSHLGGVLYMIIYGIIIKDFEAATRSLASKNSVIAS